MFGYCCVLAAWVRSRFLDFLVCGRPTAVDGRRRRTPWDLTRRTRKSGLKLAMLANASAWMSCAMLVCQLLWLFGTPESMLYSCYLQRLQGLDLSSAGKATGYQQLL